jgi:hypothetical protein
VGLFKDTFMALSPLLALLDLLRMWPLAPIMLRLDRREMMQLGSPLVDFVVSGEESSSG